MTTPVLKATGLHRHFEGVHAVAGVDLEIAPGQTVAIIGPNGSGKTTTLNRWRRPGCCGPSRTAGCSGT